MKSLNEIYTNIYNSFKKRTKLDIAKGSVLDSYFLASSEAIQNAHMEIDNNKTPHLYTGLKGDNLDDFGILVGCPREAREEDLSYKSRLINWNTNNQKSNITAIESAMQNLQYSSSATYVPLTQGVGTASIFIIPKELTDINIKKAITEVREKVEKVISPNSYVDYTIPKILPVQIVVYASIIKDTDNTKKNIEDKVEKYINSIKPGDSMSLGELNRIGINEINMNYFSISNILINEKEEYQLDIIQELESKLIFDKIIWNMVER